MTCTPLHPPSYHMRPLFVVAGTIIRTSTYIHTAPRQTDIRGTRVNTDPGVLGGCANTNVCFATKKRVVSRVHHPTLGNSIHARQRDTFRSPRACLPTSKKMTRRGATNEPNRHELSQADGKQPRLGPPQTVTTRRGRALNPPSVVIPGDLQKNVSSQDQRMNSYTHSHPSSHL